jgi:hypothetical protein
VARRSHEPDREQLEPAQEIHREVSTALYANQGRSFYPHGTDVLRDLMLTEAVLVISPTAVGRTTMPIVHAVAVITKVLSTESGR